MFEKPLTGEAFEEPREVVVEDDELVSTEDITVLLEPVVKGDEVVLAEEGTVSLEPVVEGDEPVLVEKGTLSLNPDELEENEEPFSPEPEEDKDSAPPEMVTRDEDPTCEEFQDESPASA